uniref:lysozyme n=1 Tax=Sinonovacula constricta TaxID=98310 RepID=A0A385XVR0_SINCO|nr:lysozyme 2 [Sinonovacula constricta]
MLFIAVFLAVVAIAGGQFPPGPVEDDCMSCICTMESGCNPLDCRMDVGSLSCGYFQIKLPYYQDCGQPRSDLGWKGCSNDLTCAATCVQNYMRRYVGRSGCSPTCQTYAREHNGGPIGCRRSSTLKYWEALKKIPGCGHLV